MRSALASVLAPLLLICALQLGAAWADDPWDVEQPDPAAVAGALEQTQAELKAAGEPADDSARVRREALLRRVALLTELAGVLAPTQPAPALTVAQAEAVAAARRAELDTLLARPVDLDRVQASTSADLAAYDEALKKAREALQAAQQGLAEVRERQIRRTRELQRDLPERLAAAQAELTGPLSASMAAHESMLRGNARLMQRVVSLRTTRAKAELARLRAQAPLAQAELDLARLRVERAQIRHQHAATSVRAELSATAGRERKEAEAAGAAAEEDPDPIRRLRRRIRAERSLVLADTRHDAAREAEFIARIRAANLARDASKQERVRIAERLAGGERADLAGRLLEARRRGRHLLDGLLQSRLPELYREIAQIQDARGAVLERLWALDVPDDENDERARFLGEVRSATPRREGEAGIVFGLAVRGQDGLLDALRARLAVLDGNLEHVEELRQATQERITALRELNAFLLSELIWIRSEPVLSPAVFASAWSEIPSVGGVVIGPDIGGPLKGWYREAPVPHGVLTLLLVLGFGALFVTTRTLRTAGGLPLPPSSRVPAVRATWSAAWRSALLPAYLVLAVVLLRAFGAPMGVGRVLGDGVLWMAGLWFAARFTWRLFRPDGVAVEQFAMQPAVAGALRRASLWVLLSGMMLALPAALLAKPPFAMVALPRLLRLAFTVVLAVAVARLIRPSSPFMRALGRNAPFWRRLTTLVTPLAILALFGIVVMEILGYRIGARFFLSGAWQTLAFLFVLFGLYQLTKRLIRALAERVRMRTAKEAGRAEAEAMSEAIVSQLSQVALTVIVIVAILLLGELWELDTTLVPLVDGVALAQLSETTALTLWDVLRAIAYVVFAHFLSRNLGAILDTVVFPAVGAADVGTRFVTLSLLRYVILLFGYGAALIALHFSFASIGWALAAVSFGLGFGMQEIVANFVSGLILLLERPVSVGDVISVGTTAGTVDRITARSTVVTNWDRKQIIVPNKRLITENVTNWTRNDPLVRRTIPVGVAYGTDVAKVLLILIEVAKAHPHVRKEPEPRVLFTGFGDSSLNFELRVFTVFKEGLVTVSELLAEINRSLLEAGIRIPFPQRDVHLHGSPNATADGPPAGS